MPQCRRAAKGWGRRGVENVASVGNNIGVVEYGYLAGGETDTHIASSGDNRPNNDDEYCIVLY